ncbi:MAG: PfkB family carbohydrate kinase [Flavobacteriales bacterium]|nr:sugar kinase [Flavobacteriales bacterium]MCZ2443618.1 PfkB family carbohydrate kinase [Flavobacteriales bacterium]
MSLLVVGTVALDSIETPFGKAERIIGGSATHFALAASFFNSDTRLVSVIGEDFPVEGLKQLAQHRINTEGLQVKRGEKSFFWAGRYHIDMNTRDTLDTQLNVLADFDPVVPESSKDVDFLMLGNLMPSIQRKVLEQMHERPKLVMMDTMNFWMDTAWDDLMDMISRVDVLTINDEEARQLTKEYSLVKAAKQIMQRGPRFLVIKKGENGALLFHENKLFFAPALPLENVFDPTGAGDSFAGGFIGYLSSKNDLSFNSMKRAVIYGSAIASFCVEKFGIERVAELTQSELDDRVQDFIDLVQFDIDLV